MSDSQTKGRLIHDQWQIRTKIGFGGFGSVYRAIDIRNGGYVAVKIAHGEHGDHLLRREYKVYKGLRNTTSTIVGIPRAHYFGTDRHDTVLVMDLLGKSLHRARVELGGTFSLKTVILIATQMLRRMQLVHHKGFVHRDVKPENMIIGREDPGRIYLVDFGVTKKYRDYHSRTHVTVEQARYIVGSASYISLNAHKGIEHTRRDDLESLGYSLVEMFRGSLPWQELWVLMLPWQNMKALSEWLLFAMIAKKKRKLSLEVLCEGMPSQFVEYFKYVRGLGFAERPDYDMLASLLRSALRDNHLREDRIFDWMPERRKRRRKRKKGP